MKFGKQPKMGRSVISRINGLIWVVGMFYLSYTGNWYPGILYLIGITILVNVVSRLIFMVTAPKEQYDDSDFEAPMRTDELVSETEILTPDSVPSSNNNRMQRLDPDPIPPAQSLSSEYRTDLLPPNCPNCGAAIKESEVEMVGIKIAKCSFCGSEFSLSE